MPAWLERHQWLVLGLAALLLLAGIMAGRLSDGSDPTPIAFRSDSDLPAGSPIRVQVAGSVVNPGVYDLHEGDRVDDAIQAAGGASDDADLAQLDLALKVRDEQQLVVPKRSGPAAPAPTLVPGVKLDINTATAAQLDQLPGIGDAYSRRIVDSRQLDGPYKSTQELVDRKVLPKPTFDQISALISVAAPVILLLVALAWLGGVVLAALTGSQLWPLLALGGVGIAAGLAIAGRRPTAVLALLLTMTSLAALARYDATRPPAHPGGVAVFNDGAPAMLRGTVISEPEPSGQSQRFQLRAETSYDGSAWQPTSGKLLVTTHAYPAVSYGDRLELTGELETPPSFDGFDYRDYLARQGVVSLTSFPTIRRLGSGGGSWLTRQLIDLRRPFSRALERSLPEPESALARGILLGERASIPAGLTSDFNRAGISHLVAISGYNVMLVAAFTEASLAWLLGRRRALLASMLLIVLYTAFVGASPSVLRAAVMGEVMLGAGLAGRPGSALTAVLAAGAGLSAWQPSIIQDVSFQLSFGATLGIVVLQRPLKERLESLLAHAGWLMLLAEPMAVTIAATVAVLPIIAASFGQVSLVALPANLLAVPAFPFIFAATGLAAGAGVISPWLGHVAGDFAYLPLTYLVRLGHFAGNLPAASLSVHGLGTEGALLLYVLIGLLALALMRRRSEAPADPTLPLLRPLLLAALVLSGCAGFVWWRDAASAQEDRLRVSILDVGQGDSILIQTPSGQRVLIDGGPSGDLLLQDLSRELPASDRRIDLVVLSHGQDDHVSGLVTLLQRYDVGEVLQGPLPGTSAAFQAWQDEVARQELPVHRAVAGEWADLGGGARLQVLNPPSTPIQHTDDDLNNNCVVLRLVYGDVSFLFTCDVEAAGEQAMLSEFSDLHSTVLKVGHHGSDGSTTPAFLQAVQPDIAVISVGADNTYGHPSPSTLLRLAGLPVLRTDQNGRVRFDTDGTHLWLQYDRGDLAAIHPLGLVETAGP